MKRTFTILFCFFSAVLFSQTKEQSDLYQKILTSADSAAKIKLYRDLGTGLFRANLYERAIHFHTKGLALATQLADTAAMIEFNLLLVNSYSNLGLNTQKLNACFAGLKLSEVKKDAVHIGNFYRIIGQAYWSEGDYKRSIEIYHKALQIAEQRKDTNEIAGVYNNIGLTWRSLKDYDKANDYYFKSIELGQLKKDSTLLSRAFNNIGYVRFAKKDFMGALEYYKISLKFTESGNDEFQKGIVLGNIGSILAELKKFDEALEYCERSLEIATQIRDREGQIEGYYNLSEINERKGNHKEALAFYKKFLEVKLTSAEENAERDVKREAAKHDFEKEINEIQKKQELKDAIARSDKEKTRLVIIAVSLGLLIVVILLVIIFKRFKISQSQKLEIQKQKKLVDEKQKEILDSIHYAKRIQSTLLAHTDFVNDHLPHNFIYFHPKDIVSGDFYWATTHGDLFYLAVCDSTGHGVPGAFMSLLNIGFLSEAINEKNILEPAAVFDHVRKRLISGMSKEGQKDGFDGILLCIDKKKTKIKYVGANNAPLLIKNGTAIELGSNKMPVGVGEKNEPFTQNELEIQAGDILYLYTDGYADQFGGPKGKKFKYSELNKLIVANSNLPLTEQKIRLETVFNEWKGNLEQVDDVLVVGIKI